MSAGFVQHYCRMHFPGARMSLTLHGSFLSGGALDRVLAIHLRAAAEIAQADVVALFVPDGGGGLGLSGSHSLDPEGRGFSQDDMDLTRATWRAHRDLLERGETVRAGSAVVWPLRLDGRFAGLVYLDRADPSFPSEHDWAHGRVLAERVLALDRRSIGAGVAEQASPDEENGRLLVLAFRQTGGNVAGSARLIGVNRDTIYCWASKYGINIEDYRPKRILAARRA